VRPSVSDPAPPTAPTRTIRLPEEVARAVEERIRGTGFGSVDAFVEFVLARLLEQPGEGGFSEEEERFLKERLRSLGYID
jgi:Arc/MetJ-type ribon-helix-helix transcriptional regulator